MRNTLIILTILSCTRVSLFAQPIPDKWLEADKNTLRLSPSDFPDLPPEIAGFLAEGGYTIPQCFDTEEPHNVIRGEFTVPGQTDWAVLASKERVSAIFVFRGGSIEDYYKLAEAPDKNYLEGVGGNKIGFFRAIGLADEKFIIGHYQAYGGTKPPPIDHFGIEDTFGYSGSRVWYWHEGKWMKLTGAD